MPRTVIRGATITIGSAINPNAQQQGTWYTPLTVPSAKSTDWPVTEVVPMMRSMFDDLCDLYPLMQRQSTTDALDCVNICREMVLSAWTAYLRIVEAQIIEEEFRKSVGRSANRANDIATWLSQSWTQPWQQREFGRLTYARLTLEKNDEDLRINMDALGVGTQNQTVEDWEADAWRHLRDTLRSNMRRLDILWQAYTQVISVRESISSNKQSRQVEYLTSLATLFIPASLIAAIFSMGGDFAVGASHFWVYWAVSAPIVALCFILLFTRLGGSALRSAQAEESLA